MSLLEEKKNRKNKLLINTLFAYVFLPLILALKKAIQQPHPFNVPVITARFSEPSLDRKHPAARRRLLPALLWDASSADVEEKAYE